MSSLIGFLSLAVSVSAAAVDDDAVVQVQTRVRFNSSDEAGDVDSIAAQFNFNYNGQGYNKPASGGGSNGVPNYKRWLGAACLDKHGASGWLSVAAPYTYDSCAKACIGYRYFVLMETGDNNCRCEQVCQASGGDGRAGSYEISDQIQPWADYPDGVPWFEHYSAHPLSGCLDGTETGGWQSVDAPYTEASCAIACSSRGSSGKDYNYFLLMTNSDWNCRCEMVCPDNGDSRGRSYKILAHVSTSTTTTTATTVSTTATTTSAATIITTPKPPLPTSGVEVTGEMTLSFSGPFETFCEDAASVQAVAVGIAEAAGVPDTSVDVRCKLARVLQGLAQTVSAVLHRTYAVTLVYTIMFPEDQIGSDAANNLIATLLSTVKGQVDKNLKLVLPDGETAVVDSVTAEEEVPGSLDGTAEADGKLDGKSADGAEEEEKKKKKKKKAKQASCFPGRAAVQVLGRGDVALSNLLPGDWVLAKQPDVYEPVLGLLHAIRSQPAKFLSVVHTLGELRASASHIVFANEVDVLVGKIEVGDHLSVAGGKSVVLSVRRGVESHGMFAPLTPSGTIVVDGALASNYAGSSETLTSPHGAAHAIAFPARIYYALHQRLRSPEHFKTSKVVELHAGLLAGFRPLADLQSLLLA